MESGAREEMEATTLQVLLKKIEEETNAFKRMELLESMRTLVANMTNDSLLDTLGSSSLEVLFDSLGSDEEFEISTICGILKSLMLVLDPEICLQKYHDQILQGFQHPHASVRALVIAQLHRCVESEESVRVLCAEYQDLIIAAINQLASDELGAAKAADRFLVALVQTPNGSEFLLGHGGIASFKTILNSPRTSETIKFRVLETLAHLGSYSSDYFHKIEDQHLLLDPLSDFIFASQDPVNQMNALEILSVAAESKHGVDHIEKTGLFKKIAGHCVNWQENPDASLFFPGILKFIGKVGVAQVPPEELIDITIDALLKSSNDFALATVATEALALIGSTNEGKDFLNQKQNFTLCLDRIRWLLSEAPVEFRTRILGSLAILFGSSVLDGEGPDFLSKWLRNIFPQHSSLFSIVQHSFPEIRLSALKLLAEIAPFEWAQAFYLRIPGVVEFLLNRNIEPNVECNAAKFEIVEIVAKSVTTSKFLPTEDIGRLKIHIDQGQHYVEPKMTVAMEGA